MPVVVGRLINGVCSAVGDDVHRVKRRRRSLGGQG